MDDPCSNGRLLDNLGSVARMRGNYAEAEAYYRQSLDAERASGSPEGRARVLNNLAEMLRAQGKQTEAVELYQESLALYRQLDIPYGIGGVLLNLAAAERDLGNHQRALDLSLETLTLLRDLDETDLLVAALIGLGGALLQLGLVTRAARIVAAVRALVERESLALEPADQQALDAALKDVRARLDDLAWREAQTQGCAVSLQQALDFALASP
jgi:tetratricopeptide (TPR) repeat protein